MTLVLIGLGVQAVLLAARWLIERNAPDDDSALQALEVVDVVGAA